MIYIIPLRVPANTPIEDPVVATLKLSACIIENVSVEFPRGCYWLVSTRARLREVQLYPTNPGEWITSEAGRVEWTDDAAIIDPPYELTIEAYNEDERYQHTIRWYLDVRELSPYRVVPGTVSVETAYVG